MVHAMEIRSLWVQPGHNKVLKCCSSIAEVHTEALQPSGAKGLNLLRLMAQMGCIPGCMRCGTIRL